MHVGCQFRICETATSEYASQPSPPGSLQRSRVEEATCKYTERRLYDRLGALFRALLTTYY